MNASALLDSLDNIEENTYHEQIKANINDTNPLEQLMSFCSSEDAALREHIDRRRRMQHNPQPQVATTPDPQPTQLPAPPSTRQPTPPQPNTTNISDDILDIMVMLLGLREKIARNS